ncbi:agrin-like [Dreissena polymorpha]|uniref:Kazal-like domain-containing protein n=1 Tax=Dreissena polymorpha TaxID=45954 RepID=A0A9D4N0Q9_DREPO|nr:agrin-like [Dreissena polymorpha]KAH3885169.1 hypothetical protein DPMN_009159 [Dreissena polymorpha]
MRVNWMILLCATVANAQNFNGGDSTWYCGILANENCSIHIAEPRCGTDLITYTNMCALGQAHCKDTTVNQLHMGPCGDGGTTTRSPEQIVHGSELVLDFQCAVLGHRGCEPAINEKICGTDGITYQNFCEYEKARCMHRELHVAKLGDCSA